MSSSSKSSCDQQQSIFSGWLFSSSVSTWNNDDVRPRSNWNWATARMRSSLKPRFLATNGPHSSSRALDAPSSVWGIILYALFRTRIRRDLDQESERKTTKKNSRGVHCRDLLYRCVIFFCFIEAFLGWQWKDLVYKSTLKIGMRLCVWVKDRAMSQDEREMTDKCRNSRSFYSTNQMCV